MSGEETEFPMEEAEVSVGEELGAMEETDSSGELDGEEKVLSGEEERGTDIEEFWFEVRSDQASDIPGSSP